MFANFVEKELCWSLYFNKAEGLRPEKVTPTKVYSCEICEIFQNTKNIYERLLLSISNILNVLTRMCIFNDIYYIEHSVDIENKPISKQLVLNIWANQNFRTTCFEEKLI